MRFTPNGTAITFVSNLDTPRGLAFDSAGNLFVATSRNVDPDDPGITVGIILKVTPDGLVSTFATGFAGYTFLQGMAIDGAGNVFVMAQEGVCCDPNLPSTIYKVAPDGTINTFYALPVMGWGLALDSAGNLYTADLHDQIIFKFTPEGVPSTFAGPAAFGSIGGPVGLAFDSSGNLFVSTESLVNSTGGILKFAPDGTLLTTIAAGLPNGCRGLAFDSAGNLFVAQPGTATVGDILKFTPAGPNWIQSTFADQGFGTVPGRGPEWLAFPPTKASITINFDAINASANFVGGATLKSYLQQYGVNINKVTAGSQVVVDDDRRVYGGGVVFASSPHNFLSDYGLNAPNSFTLNFDKALDSISFTRIAGGPYPTAYASWTATALSASGAVLSTVSEFSPGFANFPAKTFTLNGARIVAVRFDSNGFGFAAFSGVLLDDLVLNYAK